MLVPVLVPEHSTQSAVRANRPSNEVSRDLSFNSLSNLG